MKTPSHKHLHFGLLTLAACLSIAPASLHAAGLIASDGAANDNFGWSVSQSGGFGLVGAYADDITFTDQGSAYVFRNLDTATGTVTQNVKLIASDGAASDQFGISVSLFGSIGLVGAYADDITFTDQGSAYVFRNLDTATGTVTQNVKLTASDAAANDRFGWSVSQSGSIGLVGAYQDDITLTDQGSAYVFRNLDTATGTVTQNVKLTASDAFIGDQFGYSVSLSGSIGLVGASLDTITFSGQGSAYVFRNLDTATGTVTQNVKLTASDAAANDQFGYSVSISGSIGLVGAYGDDIAFINQGSAYVFRNLDVATGTVTQNVKLTASDAAANDQFGYSVSLSGSIGLVGVYGDDITFTDQGSAYVFRNLDTATGTVTQNVKLTASDAAANDRFGYSVSLSGDQFTIGAPGKNSSTGKAYSGSVSSVTTLDVGNISRTIDGISFVSQDDWIIGQTTSSNQVTLNAGNTGNVKASGKTVYIGKNAGSNNNTLIIAGSLTASQITVGAAGNTGNILQLGAGGTTGTLSTGSVITNNGKVVFNRSNTITQGTDFGSAGITGTGSVTQAGSGTTVLNVANGFNGATLISGGTLQAAAAGALGGTNGVTVNTGGTLLLSNAGTTDRINNSATVTLAGGKFDTGGLSETVGALTLSLSSVIDMGVGGNSILRFADSSALTWTGTLSIWNWSGNQNIGGGTDQLFFGNGSGAGLSSSQLTQVKFYSDAGTTILPFAPGFSAFTGGFGEIVPVPEPSSVVLAIGLFGLIVVRERSARRRIANEE